MSFVDVKPQDFIRSRVFVPAPQTFSNGRDSMNSVSLPFGMIVIPSGFL